MNAITRQDATTWLQGFRGRNGFLGSVADQLSYKGHLSDRQWATVIRIMGERQAQAQASPDATPDAGQSLTPGVYRHDGQVYVVKPTRDHHDGQPRRLYAKLLTESAERVQDETGERVHFELVYAPGVIRHLAPTDLLPLEDAKALIIRYGRCIACGRHLKAADSVERGIGPVCVKMFAAPVLAAA